jgi:hypothetical protein
VLIIQEATLRGTQRERRLDRRNLIERLRHEVRRPVGSW